MIKVSNTLPEPLSGSNHSRSEGSVATGLLSHEIEAKFLIPKPALIATLSDSLELDGMDVHPQSSVKVVDRYLDTVDWQVLQAGWALRWRDVAGRRSVGLKSADMNGEAVQRRTEVEQSVDVIPRNGRRLPEGKFAETLGDIARNKLRELFRVHNHRKLYTVRTLDGALVEMAVDYVTVTATNPRGKRASGRLDFDELELKLKEGTEESLRQFADTIGHRFGLLPSRLSKFERGLQCAGLCPPPHIHPRTRSLEDVAFFRQLRARRCTRKTTVNTLVYRYLLEQFQALLLHEPRAWEGLDVEGVHQMRVATRRIRAALRAFKRVLPVGQTKTLSDEFKWVAGVLGHVRDLDVCTENLQRDQAEISVEDSNSLTAYRHHIAQQSQDARRQLVFCLSNPRYRQLKDSFAQFLQRGASETVWRSKRSSIGKVKSVGNAARRSIVKQYKKLLGDGRSIRPDSPDEALHALRIDCKRMRYLFEFFQPVYGKSLSPFIRRLTKLQTVLGEFQDACVAIKRLREYADAVPMESNKRGELIALGQLIYQQHCLAKERREDFVEVWKRFDRKGSRRQIHKVLK